MTSNRVPPHPSLANNEVFKISPLAVCMLMPRSNAFCDEWGNGIIQSSVPAVNQRMVENSRFNCTDANQNICTVIGKVYNRKKHDVSSVINASKFELVLFCVEPIPADERLGARAASPNDLRNACNGTVHPSIRAVALTKEKLHNAYVDIGEDYFDDVYIKAQQLENLDIHQTAASFLNFLGEKVLPRESSYELSYIKIAQGLLRGIKHQEKFVGLIWGIDLIQGHIKDYNEANSAEEKLPHIKFIIRFDLENFALVWGVGIAALDGLHRCTGVTQLLCGQYPRNGQKASTKKMQQTYDAAARNPIRPSCVVANINCLQVIDDAALEAQRVLSRKAQKSQDKASPATLFDFSRNVINCLLKSQGLDRTLKHTTDQEGDLSKAVLDGHVQKLIHETIKVCKKESPHYTGTIPDKWANKLDVEKICLSLLLGGKAKATLPFPLNMTRNQRSKPELPKDVSEFNKFIHPPGDIYLNFRGTKNVDYLTAAIILLSFISTIDENYYQTVMDLVTPSAWDGNRAVKEPTSNVDARDALVLTVGLLADAQFCASTIPLKPKDEPKDKLPGLFHNTAKDRLELCQMNFSKIVDFFKRHSSMNPVPTEQEKALISLFPDPVKVLPVKYLMMQLHRNRFPGPFALTESKIVHKLTQDSRDSLEKLYTAVEAELIKLKGGQQLTEAESKEVKRAAIVRSSLINIDSFDILMSYKPDAVLPHLCSTLEKIKKQFIPCLEVQHEEEDDLDNGIDGNASVGTFTVAAASAAGVVTEEVRRRVMEEGQEGLSSVAGPAAGRDSAVNAKPSDLDSLELLSNTCSNIDKLSVDVEEVIHELLGGDMLQLPQEVQAQLDFEASQEPVEPKKKIVKKRKSTTQPTEDAPAGDSRAKTRAGTEEKNSDSITASTTTQKKETKNLNDEALAAMTEFHDRRGQINQLTALIDTRLPKRLPKNSQQDYSKVTSLLKKVKELADKVQKNCIFCISNGCQRVCVDNTLYCSDHLICDPYSDPYWLEMGTVQNHNETATAPCSFSLQHQCIQTSEPERRTIMCATCFSSYAHPECCKALDTGLNVTYCLNCHPATQTERCDCKCDGCQTSQCDQTCIMCNKGVHDYSCCSINIENLMKGAGANDSKQFLDFLNDDVNHEYARRLYTFRSQNEMSFKESSTVICLGCKEQYFSM